MEQNKDYFIEVCAASLDDCQIAHDFEVASIELNSALFLGGLTPSLGLLKKAKEITDIPIMTMVRCRPGGFVYDNKELDLMYYDAKLLLENGADGIVFGFLNEDLSVNLKASQKMIELCHSYGAKAIFHRAVDQTVDYHQAFSLLAELGIDRILSSGQASTFIEGAERLKEVHKEFKDQVEIYAGSGLSARNASVFVEETGIKHLHGSFKTWYQDPSTETEQVSYAFSDKGAYDGVSRDHLLNLIQSMKKD